MSEDTTHPHGSLALGLYCVGSVGEFDFDLGHLPVGRGHLSVFTFSRDSFRIDGY